jgi:hypothetical protein
LERLSDRVGASGPGETSEQQTRDVENEDGRWRKGYPPVFLSKSSELLENKRVEFLESAKKCKRVRKSVRRKDLAIGEDSKRKKQEKNLTQRR